MFSLLWEAIIGLIVGALAKLIMPGKDPGGIFITMLIGVAGCLAGYFYRQPRGPVPGGPARRLHHVAAGRHRAACHLPPDQGQNGNHLVEPPT